MSLYEISIIVKNMPKARTVASVKRVAESILDEGGFVSKIEGLGAKDLPYKMRSHGQVHVRGSYFLIQFAAPPTTISDITDNCIREVDLVRNFISKVETPSLFACTLHEDIKPPAYRPEVHKMIEEAKKRVPIHERKKFKLNTGIGYNPF